MTYVTGYVLAKISIFGSIFVIRPSKLVIRPNFTLRAGGGGTSSRQNGWKRNWYDFGVIFDEKIRISGSFWWIGPLWRSSTPHTPLKQGGGGASYRQNGWKHKWYGFRVIFDEEFEYQVHFGESTPYGGHPHFIYPSNRVEGCKLPPKWMKTLVVWFWGDFWRGIRISGVFWWIGPLWRSSTPHLSLKQGGGGASYHRNWWKHNRYGFRVFLGKTFEFQVHFGHSIPYGGNPPKYTRQTGCEGVQPTLKMGENTICIVFGCFWARNSSFESISAIRPPMVLIHPIYDESGKKKPSKLSHTEKKPLEANLLTFHQKTTDHIRKTFP